MELLSAGTYSPEIMTITLKSSDGQQFQIDIKSAKRSTYIADLIEEHKGETEFLIPEVEAKILKKIVEYLIHYKETEPKDIKRPLKDSKIEKILDKWDYTYITSFALADCVDLLNAATFMDIQPLLRLMCARIAALMIELPLDEVKTTFGIECDMTEEEKERFRKYVI
jgi:S-phase kinase-associated protein 1